MIESSIEHARTEKSPQECRCAIVLRIVTLAAKKEVCLLAENPMSGSVDGGGLTRFWIDRMRKECRGFRSRLEVNFDIALLACKAGSSCLGTSLGWKASFAARCVAQAPTLRAGTGEATTILTILLGTKFSCLRMHRISRYLQGPPQCCTNKGYLMLGYVGTSKPWVAGCPSRISGMPADGVEKRSSRSLNVNQSQVGHCDILGGQRWGLERVRCTCQQRSLEVGDNVNSHALQLSLSCL